MHLGLLVPWANTVMEYELPALTGTRAAWHISRMVPMNRGTRLDREFVEGLHSSVPQCLEQLSVLPLAKVYLGCTSASFDESLSTRAHGVWYQVITAFGAIMRTIRRYEWQRITLVTPYTHEVTVAESRAFERAGVVVSAAASLGHDDAFDTVPAAKVMALAQNIFDESSDALIISCTNLKTLSILRPLQEQLRVPVVSTNRALALMCDGS